jgi:RND superfamily putative drug exporter
MLQRIARFDIRFRWLIVLVWFAGVIAAMQVLPSLASVTQSNNVQFLSSSSPSVQANSLAAPFQGTNPSGTAVIVAYRDSGPRTAADSAAMARVEAAARRVTGVTAVRDGGTSKDGEVAEALVETMPSAASSSSASRSVVDGLRATFSQVDAPPGLAFHLTGSLAVSVDSSASTSSSSGSITRFTLLFVVVLLFLVYRAVLAPLVTLIPAALAAFLSGPLVAETVNAGLSVAPVAQELLIVLLLGAGSDYGLFLSFRVREELAKGSDPQEALVTAVSRVGQAITFSGLTVAAALLTLLLAPLGIFRGLGPALAIGIGVMMLATLTLTPALLAIFGTATFWPTAPRSGAQRAFFWGRVAQRVVRHPVLTLVAGIIVFGALASGLTGYRTGGLTSTAPSGSDSAAGQAVIAAHFPKATVGSDQLVLRYASPVWANPSALAQMQKELAADPVFRSITGPLGPGRGTLDAAQFAELYASLGPPATLPDTPPPSTSVTPAIYQAYRAAAQFISADGRTVREYASLQAGQVGSPEAAAAIPQARSALDTVANATGAEAHGVAGQDASAYDIDSQSTTSLVVVVPVVLALILVLLGLLLRSLVAPWYLALTVGLSYLASLGFAVIVFVDLGGNAGLIFVLPLLMFVFSMALGEDYNILVMSRIREEAHHTPDLSVALTRAIGVTGGTVTSAGIILAGTFAVLGLAGGSSEAEELGFSIAFGVLLDTFFVRTLLVPALARLLERWNWWPSRLSRGSELASGQPGQAA